jgi:chloramphenicol-sensitive protein RarD
MLLLMSSGIVTAVPLLFFAGAARRLKLSTIGFLMYINPTLQFCLALLVFDEPLSEQKLLSFTLIWLALGLYSWSAWRERKPSRPA